MQITQIAQTAFNRIRGNKHEEGYVKVRQLIGFY